MRELSYVTPTDPAWKRWLIATIEDISGRRKILPYYQQWRRDFVGKSPSMMRDGLDLIDVNLDIRANGAWPPKLPPGHPLVMIANHPFGIGDGVAALSLAEELGRPYRVLINNDLLRVPEVRPYALPIDFSESREAVEMNLRSRAEARRLLKEGVTIIVFPAGGVATAHNPFGKAEELPWKTFTARLVQLAEASVLPVFFEGQNSVLFHAVSRVSLTLRLSLLVSEFRNMPGSTFNVHVGEVTPFSAIPNRANRMELTRELYLLVRRLDPAAAGKSDEDLEPTPPDKRPAYPWE
ncbi:MAG: lysophospholipid acyltransferase family protein [Alphaproteobacteria bacterium]|nr:lysophospholipid acyltransferase family protein [Alphaproteobacteria bacterium]